MEYLIKLSEKEYYEKGTTEPPHLLFYNLFSN